MEYAQKNISPVLARILAQMQQTQQFQPQSYGALAAGLGATALDKFAMNKEMKREQAQKQAQQQALARALGQFGQESMGGPINMPSSVIDEGGTRQSRDIRLDTLPDPAGARNNLLAALIGNEHPMAQAGAGALFQQQISNAQPEPQSPAGKLRADLKSGIITKEDFQRETTQTSTLPNEIKIAQFMYPDDEAKQREFLQTKSSSDLPAQIQVALWASDGDAEKARALVRKKLEGKDQDLSLSGLMAGVVQKLVDGKELTAGEKEAMNWYKQNPLAALFAILGAKAGTTVEE